MTRIFAPKRPARRLVVQVEPGWATHRQRRKVARAIATLARPISRPQLMLGPQIGSRHVAGAALPHLLAVQPLLGDPDVKLPADVVDAMWRFLTDGLRSPLFEDSPEEARQHAYWLSRRLLRDSVVEVRAHAT
jgi:hypothetical protein